MNDYYTGSVAKKGDKNTSISDVQGVQATRVGVLCDHASKPILNVSLWPSHLADFWIRYFGRENLKKSLLGTSKYFCSFFSGVGTVERAVSTLSHVLNDRGVAFNPAPLAACVAGCVDRVLVINFTHQTQLTGTYKPIHCTARLESHNLHHAT